MSNATKCRSCGAEIMWVELKSGKKMPVDLPALPDSKDDFYNETVVKLWPDGVATAVHIAGGNLDDYCEHYRSHFATCPQADDWRSKPASAGKKLLQEKVAASKLFRGKP